MMNYFANYNNDMELKGSLKKEFLNFCKANKKDKKSKEMFAEDLWIKYKDIKASAYDDYYHNFIDIKIDQANARSNYGVKRYKPPINLKQYNLNLKNDMSMTSFSLTILLTTLLTTIDIMIFLYSILILGIIFLIFILLIVWIIINNATGKYKYIEKQDNLINYKNSELNYLISNFNRIYKNSRFQNGNLKWTVFEKRINELYKENVIKKLPNPYKVDSKKVKVNSSNFITSGGVYAWWYQDEVIYIGKANNFKRRMSEHTNGLSGMSLHNEHKYNAGLTPNDIYIQILAITNDEDEQSVLESFYFNRYNNGQLLNSTGTLSWKKIMTRERYRRAWENIKEKVKDK